MVACLIWGVACSAPNWSSPPDGAQTPLCVLPSPTVRAGSGASGARHGFSISCTRCGISRPPGLNPYTGRFSTQAVPQPGKRRSPKSVWEDGDQGLGEKTGSILSGASSQEALLQAFLIRYLTAFLLETKAPVVHMTAGALLPGNVSEQLCPSVDRLSASRPPAVSAFRVAPLPDSGVGGEKGFASLSLAPGPWNLPPK